VEAAFCANVPAAVRSRVAAVRGSDLRAMTLQALEAIGGMGSVVHPGETVFIKPNMVTLPWASYSDPFRSGECTKPDILAAAAEACLEAGAKSVTIGDGSQVSRFDWSQARLLSGSTDLAAEAKRLGAKYGRPVKLACLDADTTRWIEVPTSTSLGKVLVSNLVVEADRVISVPVAKTHKYARVTLSIKNFIGITPLERYGCVGQSSAYSRVALHQNDMGPRSFNRLGIDLAKAAHPDLAIIDFSIGMEGDGPSLRTGGSAVDVKTRLGSWLVLASKDLVAADATAARIMGQESPYVDETLSMAAEEGMGFPCERSIELVGDRLEALRMPWRSPQVVMR
jgi:uncharacterized protein (DUF362 family)